MSNGVSSSVYGAMGARVSAHAITFSSFNTALYAAILFLEHKILFMTHTVRLHVGTVIVIVGLRMLL